MEVDVVTEIEIGRPRAQVAQFAADVDNVPRWHASVESVEWETAPPLVVGSRVAFVAKALGCRIAYTYEISELVPGERLAMSTDQGPLPIETTYTWSDAGEGSTRMTLRNRGQADRRGLAAPLMERAMRRANAKDLRQLKQLIESIPAAPEGAGA